MRMSHNHMCANDHKALFHIDFHHFMKLEAAPTLLVNDKLLGVQREEVEFMKQRMNRA